MTMREIHPQAIVAAGANLGEGVKIGAFAIVGEEVELGDGCVVHAHAVVQGPSKFGKNNVFHPFSVVGGDPQDYTFRGERAKIVTERATKNYGINTIGLERKGFSPKRLEALKHAYRLLLRSKLNTSQALAEMKKTFRDSADVQELIRFIEGAERGIVK